MYPYQAAITFDNYHAHTEPRLGRRASESLNAREVGSPLMAVMTIKRGGDIYKSLEPLSFFQDAVKLTFGTIMTTTFQSSDNLNKAPEQN